MESNQPAQGAGIGAPHIVIKGKRPGYWDTVDPVDFSPLLAEEEIGKELADYGYNQDLV